MALRKLLWTLVDYKSDSKLVPSRVQLGSRIALEIAPRWVKVGFKIRSMVVSRKVPQPWTFAGLRSVSKSVPSLVQSWFPVGLTLPKL